MTALPRPADVVGTDLSAAGVTLTLEDGSFIGPIPLHRFDLSVPGWDRLALAPEYRTSAVSAPDAAALPPRRRPLHRSLTSPRRWAMRGFYRGLR